MACQRNADGTVNHFLASLLDITERKQAEAALESSLREKVALLNEVHHRVKNNLQVITSLLRMEARRSEHPATKSVLQEMKGRIMTANIFRPAPDQTLRVSSPGDYGAGQSLVGRSSAGKGEILLPKAHLCKLLSGPEVREQRITHHYARSCTPLARLFHSRSGFSVFSGNGYGKDGGPAGFSSLARRSRFADAKTSFFCGARRRSADPARGARRFWRSGVRATIRRSSPAASTGRDRAETGPAAERRC